MTAPRPAFAVPSFVALDAEFAADPEGRRLSEVRGRLEAGLRQARERLDRGVRAEEARRLRVLIAAYSAALDLLPDLWSAQQHNHGGYNVR